MQAKGLKIGIIALFVLSIIILVWMVVRRSNPKEIQLKPTVASVESVRPTGILYLYSTITEEYAKGTFMGSGLGSSILGKDKGILKKEHDCVQILRQQVSFTIDLDKVTYVEDPEEGSNKVFVTLPAIEFHQSTLSSWFSSDNENEEQAVSYDAKPLIKEVEQKVAKKYNTKENRKKAKDIAKETISAFLNQCGKEASFTE
ncbi:MAG: DUF4230 domain-containing protein [Bacteroidales bacterium]|nr:DUF4230 domain-containing protein [Bacteroidales bacterium]